MKKVESFLPLKVRLRTATWCHCLGALTILMAALPAPSVSADEADVKPTETESPLKPEDETESSINFDEDITSDEALSFNEEKARMLRICRTKMSSPECAEWKIVDERDRRRMKSRDCSQTPFSERCIDEKNKKLDLLYRSERQCADLEGSPSRQRACKQRQGKLFGW